MSQETLQPTESEKQTAWIFAIVYTTLMVVIAGIFAVVVVSLVFKGTPPTIGFLIAFMVYGMTPIAAQSSAQVLAETRGMPPLTRLGKMIKKFHS